MKGGIVFDSSTLILLAKISLLRDVAGETKCIITDVVERECIKKDTYDSKIIKELVKEEILGVVNVKSNEFSKIVDDFGIQAGEASSFALAIKEKYILATDDKSAIKACVILNTDFTTAIHFVVRSYKRGIIDKETALAKISSLEVHGRYKPQMIEDAKQRIEGDSNERNSKHKTEGK